MGQSFEHQPIKWHTGAHVTQAMVPGGMIVFDVMGVRAGKFLTWKKRQILKYCRTYETYSTKCLWMCSKFVDFQQPHWYDWTGRSETDSQHDSGYRANKTLTGSSWTLNHHRKTSSWQNDTLIGTHCELSHEAYQTLAHVPIAWATCGDGCLKNSPLKCVKCLFICFIARGRCSIVCEGCVCKPCQGCWEVFQGKCSQKKMLYMMLCNR